MAKKNETPASPYAALARLFGASSSPDLEVEKRAADDEILDEIAATGIAIARATRARACSPDATESDRALTLGAMREAREAVRARKQNAAEQGGAMSTSVTVRIEHSGRAASDDLDEMLRGS